MSAASTEGVEAPVQRGARREHTGSIRPTSNAVGRDASAPECRRTHETGYWSTISTTTGSVGRARHANRWVAGSAEPCASSGGTSSADSGSKTVSLSQRRDRAHSGRPPRPAPRTTALPGGRCPSRFWVMTTVLSSSRALTGPDCLRYNWPVFLTYFGVLFPPHAIEAAGGLVTGSNGNSPARARAVRGPNVSPWVHHRGDASVETCLRRRHQLDIAAAASRRELVAIVRLTGQAATRSDTATRRTRTCA